MFLRRCIYRALDLHVNTDTEESLVPVDCAVIVGVEEPWVAKISNGESIGTTHKY
jgi:hypothetical protein